MAQPEISDFEPNLPEVNSDKTAFTVTDDSSAEWAMRKLAKIRGKQDENKTIYATEAERIRSWLNEVNDSLNNDAQYFESILAIYALKQRSEGRKSIVLPHGTVKTTQGQPKVEINEEPFIKWATVNAPSLVRIKVEPALDEIKKLINTDLQVVTAEGEIVPSVTIIGGVPSVSFSIKK